MKKLHIRQIPAAARRGRAVLLKIEGELVADNVPPVQELLLGVLPEAKSVRIELQEVLSMDLAFVQLLWSARRTAAALNKNFTVEETLPDELRALLQTAGLDGLPTYTHQPPPAHSQSTAPTQHG
jgi:ABC-type transporter Mla MlaB component